MKKFLKNTLKSIILLRYVWRKAPEPFAVEVIVYLRDKEIYKFAAEIPAVSRKDARRTVENYCRVKVMDVERGSTYYEQSKFFASLQVRFYVNEVRRSALTGRDTNYLGTNKVIAAFQAELDAPNKRAAKDMVIKQHLSLRCGLIAKKQKLLKHA